jgi:DNA-binding MarR family transcriptional regulator
MSKIDDTEYDIWILLSRVSYFLFIIKALGNEVTPSKISEYVYQQRSTVSDILNRMVKKGLITKTKKSSWKKRVIVTLTSEGEKALTYSKDNESIHKVLSSLTEDKKEQLESLLGIIHDKAISELTITDKTNVRPSWISRYYRRKNQL